MQLLYLCLILLSYNSDYLSINFIINWAYLFSGHFLLTELLLPLLKAAPSARIVNVSALAHFYSETIDVATVDRRERWDSRQAYARSKLAQVFLFTLYTWFREDFRVGVLKNVIMWFNITFAITHICSIKFDYNSIILTWERIIPIFL